jgi:hypothetical protein
VADRAVLQGENWTEKKKKNATKIKATEIKF